MELDSLKSALINEVEESMHQAHDQNKLPLRMVLLRILTLYLLLLTTLFVQLITGSFIDLG